MRIVALDAICGAKRLVLMRLLQGVILRVVTIDAQRRSWFCQVIIELLFSTLARFVSKMAGFATHIQCRVPASLLRNVQPGGVAAQTEIFLFSAFGRFEQLELVVGFVWIVALQAIAPRGRVDDALNVRGILVRVASEAERSGIRRDQLDACDVFVYADFVAA